MIFIAHRGNTVGPKPEHENKPYYIEKAIKLGYDVEVDVWSNGIWFWLGHDQPDTWVGINFLRKYKNRLWCHAKNPQTLAALLDEELHCFYHVEDKATLTSRNFIWTHPNCMILNYNSICVLPERGGGNFIEAAGVCSDYVDRLKGKI